MKKYLQILFLLGNTYLWVACSALSEDNQLHLAASLTLLEEAAQAEKFMVTNRLNQLKEEVERNGNLDEHRQYIKDVEDLQRSLANLVTVIESIKQNMLQTHQFEGFDEHFTHLLDSLEKQQASLIEKYSLKATEIQKISADELRHKPYQIVLNLLTIQQIALYQRQHTLISQLIKKIDFFPYPDGKRYIKPILYPIKDIISQGEALEFKLTLHEVIWYDSTTVTCNGKQMLVERGIGKIRLPATSIGKHSYKSSISAKNSFGKDITFTKEASYEIVQK